MVSVEKGNMEMVKILIDNGALPCVSRPYDVNIL
jgi:hypothetical protein